MNSLLLICNKFGSHYLFQSQDEYERESAKTRKEEGKRYVFNHLEEIALVRLFDLSLFRGEDQKILK